jgi:hypothetical protein
VGELPKMIRWVYRFLTETFVVARNFAGKESGTTLRTIPDNFDLLFGYKFPQIVVISRWLILSILLLLEERIIGPFLDA